MCINTKIIESEEKWLRIEEVVGMDRGLEEVHSAIYHHGRDRVGNMVEEHAGDFYPP